MGESGWKWGHGHRRAWVVNRLRAARAFVHVMTTPPPSRPEPAAPEAHAPDLDSVDPDAIEDAKEYARDVARAFLWTDPPKRAWALMEATSVERAVDLEWGIHAYGSAAKLLCAVSRGDPAAHHDLAVSFVQLLLLHGAIRGVPWLEPEDHEGVDQVGADPVYVEGWAKVEYGPPRPPRPAPPLPKKERKKSRKQAKN